MAVEGRRGRCGCYGGERKSALTGESLPAIKSLGDGVYSGSTCKQGEIEAVVIATGVHTFFGKATHLVVSIPSLARLLTLWTAQTKLVTFRSAPDVLTAIETFFICSIAVGMEIEIIVMYPIQHRDYSLEIDNLLVFARGVGADTVVLMATRASRVENQDAIDTAIVGTLADPKEACRLLQGLGRLAFKRFTSFRLTPLISIDSEGKMHRVSKAAPEQILNLAHNNSEIERKVHPVIDKFAETFFV
ncbi:hypothetical protein RHSIM_Rhsim05G0090400 [Rhododendron simsii]|uniref:P-type ATPase A domain-containing protein n=1 Tax=Rhododendron simsii TaxID=118357 RepID=A0A834LPL9_RHOSS|nr:hypothetical protein RHSIM_Rhsim05G0090400 [Rhododendron simsii]